MKISQRWKQTTIANRLMVVLTAIMAAATLFLAIASIFQYLTARVQSEATKEQASVAHEQAEVMRRQLDSMDRALVEVRKEADATVDAAQAAKDSASAANTAIEQNKELIKSAQVQANTSQVSARAAESSAKASERSVGISEQALRAQIGIEQIMAVSFEPNKPALFFIVWKNDGNSPATIVRSIAKIGIFPQVPGEDVCQGMPNAPMRPITVSPHNTRPQTISVGTGKFSPEEIQAVKDGKSYFVICGQVVYTTVGMRDTFPLCSYSTKELNVFLECGTRIEQ